VIGNQVWLCGILYICDLFSRGAWWRNMDCYLFIEGVRDFLPFWKIRMWLFTWTVANLDSVLNTSISN